MTTEVSEVVELLTGIEMPPVTPNPLFSLPVQLREMLKEEDPGLLKKGPLRFEHCD